MSLHDHLAVVLRRYPSGLRRDEVLVLAAANETGRVLDPLDVDDASLILAAASGVANGVHPREALADACSVVPEVTREEPR